MSDSEDSTVTYTKVSSLFEDLSDIRSPRVDELPMMPQDPYSYVEATLQAPPSPDYVPGPEHPPSPAYASEFVLKPVYLEFMPPEDNVLLAEEQPLPVAISPTTDSPRYIPKEDPKEDLEEDDKDPEEDPANYPTDKEGEEEEESSEDDDDDEEEDEEAEEEEHLASADFVPPPIHRVTARMLRAKSPSTSHLPPPIVLLNAKVSMAMLRATAPSMYILAPRLETPPSRTPPLLPIPLHASSPPLLLPSTRHRVDVPEVILPLQKRLCIAQGLRFEVDKSSLAPTSRPTGGFKADYEFVSTLDDEIRHDTGEIYRRLYDAQDDRLLMSGQLNMLRKDRRANARTARLMECEARLSPEAWVQSIDSSDTARVKVMSLRTTLLA
uniref:Reverse transcriptase domain-containing protein n=1 Tax=Tanacetum cinerariifolium TaxID=118510 RepID=A0A699JL68_TANCI|nr:hypothetical protein [Tanacetum cinerariifolium]